MAITFYVQSKKNPATIYVRIRKRPIDAKARTKYSINPKWFEKGEVKPGNEIFKGLQLQLDTLREEITALMNNRTKDEINSKWLDEILNQ